MPIPARLMTKPVDLIDRAETGEDAHGQPIYTETTTPKKAYVYQKRTGDRDSGTGRVSILWENYWVALPPDTDVTSVDAVRFDGVTYEVVGEPHKQWNPRTQAVEFLELEVRRAGA